MTLKKIKVGSWYQTKHGVGRCVKAGGTFPPTAEFIIMRPFPLGRRLLKPAEVLEETEKPAGVEE